MSVILCKRPKNEVLKAEGHSLKQVEKRKPCNDLNDKVALIDQKPSIVGEATSLRQL